MTDLVERVAQRLIESGFCKPPDDDDTRFWADGSVLQSHAETIVYAVLRALRPDIDGWKLVPVEPTDDMRFAGARLKGVYAANRLIKPQSGDTYRAMLAASPNPLGEGDD